MENSTLNRGKKAVPRKCAANGSPAPGDPQLRSWAGLPVSYLGRVADVGDRQFTIGEPCGSCDHGRIVVSCGVVRCNTCQKWLGELRRFVDEGFSVSRAIEVLQEDLHL